MVNGYQVYSVVFRTIHSKILDLAPVVSASKGSSPRTGMVVEASRGKFNIFTIRSPCFTLDTIEVSISVFNHQIVSSIISVRGKYVVSHVKQSSDDVRLAPFTFCLWSLFWSE